MARERPGRRDRWAARSTGLRLLPWQPLSDPNEPLPVLDADQIEAIHRASLRILSDIGMGFLHPRGRAIGVAAP